MMKTGFAFADHIKTERLGKRQYKEGNFISMRDFILLFFLILFAVILFIKLLSLQLLEGSYFRGLSDSNRIRTKIIHAPRGIIFDRNNKPLVYNIPGFRKIEKAPSSEDSLGPPRLGEAGKTVLLSKDDAIKRLSKDEKNIEVDSLRSYPYKDATSHVLGYISQITKEQLQKPEFEGYSGNDLVGTAGIEEEYEQMLRGVDGKQLIEVNALGDTVRKLGQTDPLSGQDISLTLDIDLQMKTYDAMRRVKKGAAIVSTPNGEILALVSKPSYDQNLFTLDSTYKATDSAYTTIESILSDDDNQPLLNRAIGGVYPPGSTFKLVTAAAGLQDNIIDKDFKVVDTGVLTVGSFSYANWFYTEYGRKESGELNIVRALARSNDIFFYKAAEKINEKRLAAMAKKFGLGSTLGIDLSGEADGTVPDPSWKQKVMGEQWYLGDTYHYGIGQGFLLTTPLQVNSWTATIANGGTVYQPHLLKNAKPKALHANILSGNTVSLIREGMIESCSQGGVAWPLFEFRVKNSELRIDGKNFLEDPKATSSADFKDYRKVIVACKTGTAQHGGETTLPHAWVTLFAPAYNPQIVITVLSESAGEGSNEAGPIAKKILEAYFGKN